MAPRAPAPPALCATEDQEARHPLVLREERMASRLKAVSFTVHIDGAWSWSQPEPPELQDPAATVRDHLRWHAAKLLRQHSVLDSAAARDAVNAALDQWSYATPGLRWAGQADALLLAVASLEQIGRMDVIIMILSTDTMMPPISSDVLTLLCERQGAIV